jgi:hypothetical protein
MHLWLICSATRGFPGSDGSRWPGEPLCQPLTLRRFGFSTSETVTDSADAEIIRYRGGNLLPL